MSLLEERIKRAAKNRPVIKKPPPEPEIPTIRGGGAAAGRPNRVTPKAALPAPQLLRERGVPRAGEPQPSALKRWVPGHIDASGEAIWNGPSLGLCRIVHFGLNCIRGTDFLQFYFSESFMIIFNTYQFISSL